jgi:hypothetical protein
LDFVVQAFQVSTHLSECHLNDSSNILANDPTRLDFSNNPKHLRPEEAVIFRSLSLSCGREGLAGEAAGEEVNASLPTTVSRLRNRFGLLADPTVTVAPIAEHVLGVGNKSFGCELLDVPIDCPPLEVLA